MLLLRAPLELCTALLAFAEDVAGDPTTGDDMTSLMVALTFDTQAAVFERDELLAAEVERRGYDRPDVPDRPFARPELLAGEHVGNALVGMAPTVIENAIEWFDGVVRDPGTDPELRKVIVVLGPKHGDGVRARGSARGDARRKTR